jgi:hypothetical protein
MNSQGDPEIKRVLQGGRLVEDEFGFFWRRLRGNEIVRVGDGCEFKDRLERGYKGFMDLQLITRGSGSCGVRVDALPFTFTYRKLDPLIYAMLKARRKKK